MRIEELAIQYCNDVISGKEVAPAEIKLQCLKTLEDLEKQNDDNFEFEIDYKFLKIVESLLKLINYATGINGVIGQPVLDHIHTFQAYFLFNVFGWKYKNNHKKYRWRNITLFIARKNAKTWLSAITLIIFMLTEDDYSEFYSICLTKELAGEVKKAISQIIDASPALKGKFKVPKRLSGNVECLLTKSYYQPRVSEAGKNNSIRPTVFIADEAGNFKDKNNINAMKSGQRNVANAIQMITTTAYAIDNSIMVEEIDYIRKILNGIIENERYFAMMYYAPEEHLWDDKGILLANPLRIEDNYNTIREDRETALEKESEREEYLTKSMNYFLPKNTGETYISAEQIIQCSVKEVLEFWRGKRVYLGIDFSQSDDLTAVSMVTYHEGKIHAKSWAFIPAENLHLKSKKDRFDYESAEKKENAFHCTGGIIDYDFVENFVMTIEEKYGVEVIQIGYDIRDALSSVRKFENAGYDCVAVKQHSSILFAPTKLIKESVINKTFEFDENKLLESHFASAKCKYDTNKQYYVSKKDSGKVDMLVALIIATYLLNQNEIIKVKEVDWSVQT